MRHALTALALAGIFAAAPALAQDARLSPLGLVNAVGLPLYTYTGDTVAGQSACNDACAATWLPYKARGEPVSGHRWSIILRDDGTKQWAYQGKPLYIYSKDEPGASPTGLSKKWKAAW